MIEQGFREMRNLFHDLGTIDRKHIPIICPREERSVYFIYKGFHSLVLLALLDGD